MATHIQAAVPAAADAILVQVESADQYVHSWPPRSRWRRRRKHSYGHDRDPQGLRHADEIASAHERLTVIVMGTTT